MLEQVARLSFVSTQEPNKAAAEEPDKAVAEDWAKDG